MNKRTVSMLLAISLTLLFLSAGAVTWAQTSANFDLRWHVIGNGGAQSNSADFRVSGTVGQNTTGTTTASSADFKVTGGFWVDVPVATPTSTPEPTQEPTPEPEGVRLPFIMR